MIQIDNAFWLIIGSYLIGILVGIGIGIKTKIEK